MTVTSNDTDSSGGANASGQTGIALDVGAKRIGVAVANLGVRFPNPLTTLYSPEQFVADIIDICRREDAAWLVLGLPRGLDGQETAQTAWVREFGVKLSDGLVRAGLPLALHWTDEALTSVRAEAELADRGSKSGYQRGDVDALAASYILDDFLREHPDIAAGQAGA